MSTACLFLLAGMEDKFKIISHHRRLHDLSACALPVVGSSLFKRSFSARDHGEGWNVPCVCVGKRVWRKDIHLKEFTMWRVPRAQYFVADPTEFTWLRMAMNDSKISLKESEPERLKINAKATDSRRKGKVADRMENITCLKNPQIPRALGLGANPISVTSCVAGFL